MPRLLRQGYGATDEFHRPTRSQLKNAKNRPSEATRRHVVVSGKKDGDHQMSTKAFLLLAATLIGIAATYRPTTSPANAKTPMNLAEHPYLFDRACDLVASAFRLNYPGKTTQSPKELPIWVRLCSAHPAEAVCEDLADQIKQRWRMMPPLKCGASLKANSARGIFDEACADLSAVWASRAKGQTALEDQHRDEIPGWMKTCRAHPDSAVCRQTNRFLVAAGTIDYSPLECRSGSD